MARTDAPLHITVPHWMKRLLADLADRHDRSLTSEINVLLRLALHVDGDGTPLPVEDSERETRRFRLIWEEVGAAHYRHLCESPTQ